MVGFIISCIGLAGLAFVAFLKIHTMFLKKYIVRWKDTNDANCWTLVSACSEWGAMRIVRNTEDGVENITKVVRQV